MNNFFKKAGKSGCLAHRLYRKYGHTALNKFIRPAAIKSRKHFLKTENYVIF